MPTIIRKKFQVVDLNISNAEQNSFREKVNEIPYLLYKVENISNGDSILINKPGGKRNFNRIAQNDFLVFLYDSNLNELVLLTHNDIFEDVSEKYELDNIKGELFINLLERVCKGEEPEEILKEKHDLTGLEGYDFEILSKLLKWIWGQEDANYPTKAGRWLSMNNIKSLLD